MQTKNSIALGCCILVFVSTIVLASLKVTTACYQEPGLTPISPKDVVESEAVREEARKLYKAATKYSEDKEYEKAIDYYERCLEKNPDHVCANNGLAWLLITCEDLKYRNLERALRLSEKAVSGKGVMCGVCWDTFGLANYLSGDIKKAHLCFLQAMTLLGTSDKEAMKNYIDFLSKEAKNISPEAKKLIELANSGITFSELYKEAELLYLQKNKPKEALDYYTYLLLSSPDHPNTHIIHYRRALVWHEFKDYNMVIFDTKKAIDKSPNYADAYVLQGIVYGKHGMCKKSLRNLNKAAKLSPGNPAVFNSRGIVYLDLKKYKEAVADFSKAIELLHSSPLFFLNRAIAYKRLKKYGSAIKDLEKVLILDPKSEKASSMLKELRETNLRNN